MSDTSNDDLRETETQMRRVLGLNHQPTPATNRHHGLLLALARHIPTVVALFAMATSP
jgi:hypothetical protein